MVRVSAEVDYNVNGIKIHGDKQTFGSRIVVLQNEFVVSFSKGMNKE